MSSDAKTTGAQPNGTAKSDAKSRTHHDGRETRAFTVEQKAAVIRVRKCKHTAFYDILGLEEVRSTCSDADIKKAYRKLSLLTHPDKNGYEGADEAFKMVSRAFQILSDADKKSQFDKFGTDPESRFSSASANPFTHYNRSTGRREAGPMFEEEMSPEELFRQFFGGGGFGGGPFGMGGGFGGPGFVFNMGGGPGVRVHQFGGNRPRRRPHNHEGGPQQQTTPMEALKGLLPLLLLFILPVLSSLWSGSSNSYSGPTIRFDSPSPPQTLLRQSGKLNIPYYVNPDDVSSYTTKNWRDLDRMAEGRYVGVINKNCEWEMHQRQRLANEAQGFFFTDHDMLERARTMDMPNCRRVQELTGQRAWF